MIESLDTVWDLATGEEFRISQGPVDQGAVISGDHVVWTYYKDNKIHCVKLGKSGRVILPRENLFPKQQNP